MAYFAFRKIEIIKPNVVYLNIISNPYFLNKRVVRVHTVVVVVAVVLVAVVGRRRLVLGAGQREGVGAALVTRRAAVHAAHARLRNTM